MVKRYKINNHLVEVGTFWVPTSVDEIEVFTLTIDGIEYADDCGYRIENIDEVMGVLFPNIVEGTAEYEARYDYISSLC